jgi:hypothetical protein
VDDLGRAISDEYPDHVEAERLEIRRSVGEVVLSQGANNGLLAGGNGLEGVAETGTPAQLHLDEDEGSAVAHDQVQLAVTGTIVALEKGIPAAGKIAQRELFAPRTREPVVQVPTPA